MNGSQTYSLVTPASAAITFFVNESEYDKI
jgi:hypothetical protein